MRRNRARYSRTKKIVIQDTSLFRHLPANRFAYDLGSRWLQLLQLKPQHSLYVGRIGISTGEDFRFFRLFWEISPASAGSEHWRWVTKGGEFSRYHCDTHLKIDWRNEPLLNRTRNSHLYGQPGATYTYRTTSNLSARVLNDGVCFSLGGPAIVPHKRSDAAFVLALMNSFVATYCLEAVVGGGDSSVRGSAARNLEPRYLEFLPDVSLDNRESNWFDEKVELLNQCLGQLDNDETDALFTGFDLSSSSSLKDLAWHHSDQAIQNLTEAYRHVEELEKRIEQVFVLDDSSVRETYPTTGWPWPMDRDLTALPREHLGEVDPIPRDEPCLTSLPKVEDYRFLNKLSHYLHADIEGLSHRYGIHPVAICERLRLRGASTARFHYRFSRELLSVGVGSIFGRWDIRLFLGGARPSVPCTFDPLPAYAPAMLQDDVGQPAVATPEHYPLSVDWDGILVDDPDHSDDIIHRTRDVLEVIWKDRVDAIEKEACEILGVADLRDYFRKPGTGGFWDDHVKRYSKSRRKAPIYWLLQSSKKNYALWIYYHRLDKDILFKALLNYVEPKIRREESRLDELRSQKSALGPAAKGAKKIDKDIDRQEAFVSELRDFEDKLRRAANLHLDPDLNDGVVLNIAPLRELVPWKEAKSYWDDLMEGKYEWSSIGKQLREKGIVPC